MMKYIDVYDLGYQSYRPVWDLQKQLQHGLITQKRKIRDGFLNEYQTNDMLLFVEHPHVYTLGKSGDSSHLLKAIEELSQIEAEYIEIDRGGDITYHGPGQIVGYPILDLDRHFTDIHKYLRLLEEVIIRTCSDFGVEAGRIDGLTGVWVDQKKICAMGIRCSRWVTMHGFAFNINSDLSYFDHIVPCGINDKSVTSLSELKGSDLELSDVKECLLKHFAEIFEVIPKVKDQKPEPEQQFSYLTSLKSKAE
ncbi:lipoyl(octanoyl) transferase LipB [Rhodohalobacter halophilus]|uniref:lipoyl(octanoyl) transferase LipB n=1 Tax=Rhodohalobacter halophilus TaxID=1812810 RepID=UPI00083F6CD9|nr:lipoyl(octanoyl) transferase LipB [Rhodohalobacter halophilus]